MMPATNSRATHDDDKGDTQCTVIKQRVLQCIYDTEEDVDDDARH